ncbi:metallophosphoesterase [Ornithinibacillus salinisoli]|uniref:Metallophosphoesterase n=1 Tax=Ornithinibacillus salinisoli TaxID=1848459 RepID=A0ABW4VWP2_9BACI
MNRRSFLKKILGSTLAVIGLGGGTYYYARDIEPKSLKIHKEEIISSAIPSTFNNFKIIQITDTHIGFQYTLEQFADLVQKINKMNPDIIVFTGDLVDEPNKYKWNNRITDLLHSLHARYGKFWVYGNHDHGGYGTDIVKNVMDQANFHLLKNNHKLIELNNDRIVMAGIDDVMLGTPDLNKTLQKVNPDLFTILLAHEPDFADLAKEYPIDVQLSGHSHGGQVRLPLIGHLYTPAYAEKYVEGTYKIDSSNLTLYVSRGIGTTRVPYRFLCKPEIHEFTLKNE